MHLISSPPDISRNSGAKERRREISVSQKSRQIEEPIEKSSTERGVEERERQTERERKNPRTSFIFMCVVESELSSEIRNGCQRTAANGKCEFRGSFGWEKGGNRVPRQRGKSRRRLEGGISGTAKCVAEKKPRKLARRESDVSGSETFSAVRLRPIFHVFQHEPRIFGRGKKCPTTAVSGMVFWARIDISIREDNVGKAAVKMTVPLLCAKIAPSLGKCEKWHFGGGGDWLGHARVFPGQFGG